MSSSETTIDARLVEQAQQHIRVLVDEAAALARQDLLPARFLADLLERTVTALAAIGYAYWTVKDDGGFELVVDWNLDAVALSRELATADGHTGWLRHASRSAEGLLVPPRAADPGDEATNPTDSLLIVAPVRIEGRTLGLIEIFQRSGTPPATHANYLRFTLQMCEIAAEFFRRYQWRQFQKQQSLWQQIEPFARQVHRSLDPRETAFTLANEGRRLIGCDRVSVALRHGKRWRIEAVSGQDVFDTRAKPIQQLAKLADVVVAGNEPLWYSGSTRNMPPQIEEALHDYLDQAQSRQVVVIPLGREATSSGALDPAHDAAAEPALGALIVEQFAAAAEADDFSQRVQAVARHAGSAVANAMANDQLFLMPLWRAIGNSRVWTSLRSMRRATQIGAAVAAVIAALILIPYPLQVTAPGTLQPIARRDVFAPTDGTVDEVRARHGQQVKAGETLLLLRNTDLDVAMTNVLGQRDEALAQLQSVEAARYTIEKSRTGTVEERNRLEGQRSELKQRLVSLDKQIELYQQKRQSLEVRSPIDGTVTTWDVEHLLRQRPVRQGQSLVSVADTTGAWQLELRLPEHRLGNIVDAQRRLERDLTVTYRLATAPGVDYQGKVVEVERAAEVRGDDGNTVLVRVQIDRDAPLYTHPGADVTAKIDCGWRPLGYVWFQDVISFVQMRILFRL